MRWGAKSYTQHVQTLDLKENRAHSGSYRANKGETLCKRNKMEERRASQSTGKTVITQGEWQREEIPSYLLCVCEPLMSALCFVLPHSQSLHWKLHKMCWFCHLKKTQMPHKCPQSSLFQNKSVSLSGSFCVCSSVFISPSHHLWLWYYRLKKYLSTLKAISSEAKSCLINVWYILYNLLCN